MWIISLLGIIGDMKVARNVCKLFPHMCGHISKGGCGASPDVT